MEGYGRTDQEKYCQSCGRAIPLHARTCPLCGQRLDPLPVRSSPVDNRDWLIVLLLCIFAGPLGLHRFYVGKIGTGILMFLTLGGLGIWVIVDLVMIVMGRFTDSHGNAVY